MLLYSVSKVAKEGLVYDVEKSEGENKSLVCVS